MGLKHSHIHSHGHEHAHELAGEPSFTAAEVTEAIEHGFFDVDLELILSAGHNRKREPEYRDRRRRK